MIDPKELEQLKKIFGKYSDALEAISPVLMHLESQSRAHAEILKAILEATPQQESIGDLLKPMVAKALPIFDMPGADPARGQAYREALTNILPREVWQKVMSK